MQSEVKSNTHQSIPLHVIRFCGNGLLYFISHAACIGIDNYLMQLDDKTVADSNYISKMRYIVATSLFHKGLLRDKQLRRMKFDKEPPPELLIEDKK